MSTILINSCAKQTERFRFFNIDQNGKNVTNYKKNFGPFSSFDRLPMTVIEQGAFDNNNDGVLQASEIIVDQNGDQVIDDNEFLDHLVNKVDYLPLIEYVLGEGQREDVQDPRFAELREVKEKALAPFYPIPPKTKYSPLQIAGVHVEKFSRPQNRQSILIVPGDLESSWVLRPLAASLLEGGLNVFLMNYPNRSESEYRPWSTISNGLYLSLLRQVYSEISKNTLSPYLFLMGFSRGGEIVQQFLEDGNLKPQTVVLLNSDFDSSLGFYRSSGPMDPKIMAQWQTMESIKPSYEFAQKYWDHVNSDPAKLKIFYASVGRFSKKLGMERTKINYAKYASGHNLIIISGKEDKTIPAAYQQSCAKKIREILSEKATITSIVGEGNHVAIYKNPRQYGKLILKALDLKSQQPQGQKPNSSQPKPMP